LLSRGAILRQLWTQCGLRCLGANFQEISFKPKKMKQ
jgi:hypothetical protein